MLGRPEDMKPEQRGVDGRYILGYLAGAVGAWGCWASAKGKPIGRISCICRAVRGESVHSLTNNSYLEDAEGKVGLLGSGANACGGGETWWKDM